MTDREITDLLFVDDGPRPAALALVFGPAEPDESAGRARHAASLYHAGHVPVLLLSGGGSHLEGSEAGLMLRVVSGLGVPREAVLVEDRSRTTFENVANSVALLDQLGRLDATRTILLISCPWHMRRVSLIARGEFPGRVGLRCCPHPGSCTARTWRASPACRKRVLGEAGLLLNFIEAGVLADPMR